MPYKAQESPLGEGKWEVVNTDTSEVKAIHEPPDAKEKAEKQVKLLHAVENDPEWGDDD